MQLDVRKSLAARAHLDIFRAEPGVATAGHGMCNMGISFGISSIPRHVILMCIPSRDDFSMNQGSELVVSNEQCLATIMNGYKRFYHFMISIWWISMNKFLVATQSCAIEKFHMACQYIVDEATSFPRPEVNSPSPKHQVNAILWKAPIKKHVFFNGTNHGLPIDQWQSSSRYSWRSWQLAWRPRSDPVRRRRKSTHGQGTSVWVCSCWY